METLNTSLHPQGEDVFGESRWGVLLGATFVVTVVLQVVLPLCRRRFFDAFTKLHPAFEIPFWLRRCQDTLLDGLSAALIRCTVPFLPYFCHIPRTMYFVMDGNRRWARQRGEPTSVGHTGGYTTLQSLLEVLTQIGVREVTVYAFSIPNFKRGENEKAFLMDLAADKFEEMLTRDDIVQRHDVRVRIVGDRSRLPQRVVAAAENIEAKTAGRTGCTLNIAFAYACRNEMMSLARSGEPWVETQHDMPALWVRTSGERRFSDFLQWQCGFAHLNFQNVLWPDFRAWHLAKALFEYNYYYTANSKAMHDYNEQRYGESDLKKLREK